jgi:hypothetical protein
MHGKFESSSSRLVVVSQGGKEFNGGNHNTEVPPSDKHGRRRSGFYVFLEVYWLQILNKEHTVVR